MEDCQIPVHISNQDTAQNTQYGAKLKGLFDPCACVIHNLECATSKEGVLKHKIKMNNNELKKHLRKEKQCMKKNKNNVKNCLDKANVSTVPMIPSLVSCSVVLKRLPHEQVSGLLGDNHPNETGIRRSKRKVSKT
ncbi:hypothetical protein CDAR_213051 [Caerostris darwini]|uniref:Uncharacterized protein n=1 Tax=Caerostris darwini TaxID=1538125 RepID=A0AAV4UBN9_9ARAC|nr:hypothetical protein CDAR_213051 [Caerostris darwini]